MSEKLQTESSPNVSNFRPGFSPEFSSEFSPNFSRIFRASFREKRRPTKNSPKSPAIFQCKAPRQARKNIHKFFWRWGKETIRITADREPRFETSKQERAVIPHWSGVVYANISCCGFHANFWDLYFERGLFSKFHLMVSVVLVVSSVKKKKRAIPFLNNPLPAPALQLWKKSLYWGYFYFQHIVWNASPFKIITCMKLVISNYLEEFQLQLSGIFLNFITLQLPFPCFLAECSYGNQERKISPKSKFWGRISRGHPGVIRADIPAQNFGQGAQNPGKKKQAFGRGHPWPEGAAIHDPKGLPKTSVRKTLGWIFVP